jgi:hypothetical protein
MKESQQSTKVDDVSRRVVGVLIAEIFPGKDGGDLARETFAEDVVAQMMEDEPFKVSGEQILSYDPKAFGAHVEIACEVALGVFRCREVEILIALRKVIPDESYEELMIRRLKRAAIAGVNVAINCSPVLSLTGTRVG